MRALLLSLAFLLPVTLWAAQPSENELVKYAQLHYQKPESYVVDKFQAHDIVFLGEDHWVKSQVRFVQHLIPDLYKAGVFNLAIEFGFYGDQAIADSLMSSTRYDPAVPRKLFFDRDALWGYREYEDLFKLAWELNHSLPRGSEHFRIVLLNAIEDSDDDNDRRMASTLQKEVISKGQKALVYCGAHHAFTRYYQPTYDSDLRRFGRFEKNRFGNITYRKITDRVFTIRLHGPWQSRKMDGQLVQPGGGLVEKAMTRLCNHKIGFDLAGTPFGLIGSSDSYYSIGYESEIRMQDLYDGYVFLEPIAKFRGVTVDQQFINERNLPEALRRVPDDQQVRGHSREAIIKEMRATADWSHTVRAMQH